MSLLEKRSHSLGGSKKHTDEIKDFRNWLKSPWANNNSRLIDMYDILMEHFPEFPASVVVKRHVFQKLYPGKPYNDTFMRKLMGELGQQLDAYFRHSYLRTNTRAKKETLMGAYFQRNHTEAAIKLAQKELDLFDKKQAKGADDYLHAFHLEKSILQNPIVRTKKLTKQDYSQNLEEKLDEYYAIQKVKFIADNKDRQKFIDGEENNTPVNVDDLYKLIKNPDNPQVGIYKILLTEELEDYNKFKLANTLFRQSFNQFTKEDQELILTRLQNILIHLYSRGDESVTKNIFELGRFGISNRILIDRGKITDRTFINIVTTGNQIGEFQYVRVFIDTYYKKIDIKPSKDIKNWADADYLFYNQDYARCIELINNCNIKHHIFSISTRKLELMAYLELYIAKKEKLGTLTDKLTLFKRNLRRDKTLAKQRKDSYRAFVFYLEKIAKLYSKLRRKKEVAAEITSLITNLEAEDNILLKSWLSNHLKKLREDSKAIPPKLVNHQ